MAAGSANLGRVLQRGRISSQSQAMGFGRRGIASSLPARYGISGQQSRGCKSNLNGLLGVMDEQ